MFSQNKVLIVEKHPGLTRMLEDHLDSLSVKAFVATSGAGGLKKAKQYRPDLILVDTGLSDMEGTELVVQIRENWQTSRIPILAISGFQFMRRECLDSGCNAFLPKPFSADELVSTIKSLLQ